MSRGEGRGASAASVRGRLRELGRQRGVEFQLLLSCDVAAEDAIEFDKASMRGEEIRSPNEYGGVRVRLVARLAGAEIPVQVDVGFGDPVEPPPRIERYPTLLDHPEPRVLVYPREAVVAEKVEAIVSLGVTTSRMKDFYDVHRLAASFEFNGPSLVRAVRATFERRRTPLPADEPVALTRKFLAAPERERQWSAFLRRSRLDGPAGGGALADQLRRFLLPVIEAASGPVEYNAHWSPGGPWEQRKNP